MGSSNRHWPSMFKRSNYENSQQCTNSFLTGVRVEERTPQPPRQRWIPRPEQIQILEDIFNSGMISPPKEEIKKIRERLLQYGPVGNVNVFYWFQNRKARKLKESRPKNMIPRKRKTKNSQNNASSSSSSSSHHQNASSNSNEIVLPNNIELPTNNEVVNLINDSPNDTIFGDQNLASDYFDTLFETDFLLSTPPLLSDISMTEQLPQNDIFMNCANGIPMNDQYGQGNIQDQEVAMNMMHHQQQQQQQQEEDPNLMSLGVTSNSLNDDDIALPPLPPIIIDAPVADPFPITQFQGVGEPNHLMAKCTVSINNEIFEVDAVPLNIRQIFGDGAVLVDSSSGNFVLTDEWGVTLESLQNGASYFLLV